MDFVLFTTFWAITKFKVTVYSGVKLMNKLSRDVSNVKLRILRVNAIPLKIKIAFGFALSLYSEQLRYSLQELITKYFTLK